MTKNLEFHFSNHLEVMYHRLKHHLFHSDSPPLMRRLIVVYGPAMKSWLMLRMAQDPDLNIAMGLEFIYLNQAFDFLTKNQSIEKYTPSTLELALAIENALYDVLENYQNLTRDYQAIWMPFVHYLKLKSYQLDKKVTLTKKMEKRLTGLSQQLARLFQDYGRYGSEMVKKWEKSPENNWQAHLWNQIFQKNLRWTYPAKLLDTAFIPSEPFSLYFFSISFITRSEFNFLQNLSSNCLVYYYMLSPCGVFWSDIRSDRERAYLQNYWQNKLAKDSTELLQLDELLRDCNSLLANFGKLGRQMVSQIEESMALTYADYILPETVIEITEDLCFNEDLYFESSSKPLSLLHALQADLLIMRNPQKQPIYNFEEEIGSIQLHIAPSSRREIQILYQNLLRLLVHDNGLSPSDMIVMAPQIEDYVPYIQAIFGSSTSQISYQILDLGMQMNNRIVQGFLQLLDLCESRWSSKDLLQLFEHESFQRRHELSGNDYIQIQEWIERAGILWGDDWLHRNEILLRRYCERGMVDETNDGTWDYGLTKLLMGLLQVSNQEDCASKEEKTPLCWIEFSQGELLGKWIDLIYSLKDDLSVLLDDNKMNIPSWVDYFSCLLETYFQPDFDDFISVEDYKNFKEQLQLLSNSGRFFNEHTFPYSTVKTHLLDLLNHPGMTYQEDHLQSVRFCSLMPLRSIPAKVIVLIGMQENTFPRLADYSSLNCMIGNRDVNYVPLSIDYDRYLFLEAIHSAKEYFFMSYQGYNQKDGKELQSSLVVEELFSYLDRYYSIKGELITKNFVFKHPFDSFDGQYFLHSHRNLNFSLEDFRSARISSQLEKKSPHYFIKEFNFPFVKEKSNSHLSEIDLKDLSFLARHPIKFHLQKSLEIYLQTNESRKLKHEEPLLLSGLDKYRLKEFAIQKSEEVVINRAEKEGMFPFGLFKTVAKRRLQEEIKTLHKNLRKHSIEQKNIFQIEFCKSCSAPQKIEEHKWIFPAITLKFEDDQSIAIIGKIAHATPQGLLALTKGTLAEACKMWPQFLMYCEAAKLEPTLLKEQLILAESPKPLKVFFDDSEKYLKEFIKYYFLCFDHFSPLLPDWISLILSEDVKGLEGKMQELFEKSYGTHKNQELLWMLNKERLPDAENVITIWKEEAEALFGDLAQFWYPLKRSQSSQEVWI